MGTYAFVETTMGNIILYRTVNVIQYVQVTQSTHVEAYGEMKYLAQVWYYQILNTNIQLSNRFM